MFEIPVLTSRMHEILFHDHKHIRRARSGLFRREQSPRQASPIRWTSSAAALASRTRWTTSDIQPCAGAMAYGAEGQSARPIAASDPAGSPAKNLPVFIINIKVGGTTDAKAS